MPEENEPDKGGNDEFKPITSQEQLDKLIGERINKVKSQFGDYDDLKAKAAEYDKAQENAKSELQKAVDRAEAAERERDSLRIDTLKAEIGAAKGLTPAQSRRLAGVTKEELEADADDLLATFGGDKGDGPTPATTTRPTENLRGGGDPDIEPEPDMSKIVADIPR